MYMWANIAPVGITACVPESPSGGTRSAWDGGGVGLKEVELVRWILVDGTTNNNEKHQQKGSSDENERNNGKWRS